MKEILLGLSMMFALSLNTIVPEKRPTDTRTISGCEATSSAASLKIKNAYCAPDEVRQDPYNIFPVFVDNGGSSGSGCWYWSVTFVCTSINKDDPPKK